ncbi:MAG TPA: hypothetical protein VE152_02180 [Acidimicrobiales bacterium]|nr:hypothetical protein [Acidimicrobiales bacterium]
MTRRGAGGEGRLGGLLGTLARRGLREGLVGGHRGWLAVWATITLLRRVRRRRPELVYQEQLTPGHALVIDHQRGPQPRGRARRRAGRKER